MRWGFIRKVYAIVFAQILLCTAVSAAMFHSHTLKTVMATGYYGTVAIGILVVLTFSLGIAMTDCAEKDPWNIVLLCIFTVALAFTIGLVCTYKIGMPIMIAVCVTAIAFLGLTFVHILGCQERPPSLLSWSFLGLCFHCSHYGAHHLCPQQDFSSCGKHFTLYMGVCGSAHLLRAHHILYQRLGYRSPC
ncbi:unnamed protein product [Cuscuta campestris]|uniref:Uncharacterized protein n=1 Tax=Cuscuta campestris TaxID=132261 RepID=A0A484M950_9ASTE|nr:unnamed protein product [Cuscuta campestris]